MCALTLADGRESLRSRTFSRYFYSKALNILGKWNVTHARRPIAVYGAKPRGRDGYLSAGYPTPDVTAASGGIYLSLP